MIKEISKDFIYYYNGVGLEHSDNLPALEFYNGERYWYTNGEANRLDGPAMDDKVGKGYCIHGTLLDKEKFNNWIKRVKLFYND